MYRRYHRPRKKPITTSIKVPRRLARNHIIHQLLTLVRFFLSFHWNLLYILSLSCDPIYPKTVVLSIHWHRFLFFSLSSLQAHKSTSSYRTIHDVVGTTPRIVKVRTDHCLLYLPYWPFFYPILFFFLSHSFLFFVLSTSVERSNSVYCHLGREPTSQRVRHQLPGLTAFSFRQRAV